MLITIFLINSLINNHWKFQKFKGKRVIKHLKVEYYSLMNKFYLYSYEDKCIIIRKKALCDKFYGN